MLPKIMQSKSISISSQVWLRQFSRGLLTWCFFSGTLVGCTGIDANSNLSQKAQVKSHESAELWISNESGREVVSTEDISPLDNIEIDYDGKLEIDSDGKIKYGGKEIRYAHPKPYLIEEPQK